MERIDWDTKLEIPVRLITLRLDGTTLDEQAESIQSKSSEVLETSIGALSMLAQMAGRRIPRSMRAAIPDAVTEILQGQLDTGSGETQDLLAPTLGEIFGSLFFVLENGGNADIIRVIEDAQHRNPDYLVVHPCSGGLTLSILECKGTTTDLHTAQRRGWLDICSSIRQQRHRGVEQLHMPDPAQLGTRLSVHSIGVGHSPLSESLRAVSVICVPDGRLLRTRANVGPSERRVCQSTSCVNCSRASTGGANLIVCLFAQQMARREMASSDLVTFLSAYRSCEQALWSGNERHLGESYRELLRQAARFERSDIERLSNFLLAPLERAAVLGLPVELSNVRLSEFPDTFQSEFSLLREDLSTEYATGEGKRLTDIASLYPQWSERGELPDRILRLEDRLHGTEFRGLIKDLGEGVLDIRICPLWSEVETAYEDSHTAQEMRSIAEQMIRDLRPTSTPVNVRWSEAFVRFRGRRHAIGEYWNRLPTPYWRGGLPGFTAWIGWDGRTRIICRFPRRDYKARG
jgi:hypothetical protein